MMIGPVHTGAHQGGHAGIHPDVFAIYILVIDGPCDQHPVGAGHIAAAFHEKFRGLAMLFFECIKQVFYFPAHCFDVQRRLVRLIGNPQSAADIYKLKPDVQFIGKPFEHLQEHPGGFYHVFIIEFIGYQHGMKSEAFGPEFHHLSIRIENLVMTDPVFGFNRIADNRIAGTTRPRIVSEADNLRNFRQLFDKRDVIEV